MPPLLMIKSKFVGIRIVNSANPNPNAARLVADPWLEQHDIPDHWDAKSTA